MIRIERMRLGDLETALDWAAAEGWNPGLDDAAAFLAADPEGFLMGWLGAEPVACISVVRHSATFGFLGLYICRPAWRGRGFGWVLWQAGLAHLGDRTVGLDGVLAQQANYRESGFVLARRTVRYQGVLGGTASGTIVPVGPAMLPELLALDRVASGVDRPGYLGTWFTDAASRRTLVSVTDGRITGVGTVRTCREGLKVGPLLAEGAAEAEAMLGALAGRLPGQALSVDVPETNAAAVSLMRRLGLRPVFETARMYRDAPPEGWVDAVFGEATLELG